MMGMRYLSFQGLAMTLLVLVMGACSARKEKVFTPQEVTITWANMSLYVAKNTPANSPTFASRGFGYIGLTMYETIVHGSPSYNSLAGQLNGLNELPVPEKDVAYDWVISLNAGQAHILKKIYNQTSDANKHRIDSLEYLIFIQFY